MSSAKRPASESDEQPPAKRHKKIAITDSNIDEVRKVYRTDCYIVATNGHPAPPALLEANPDPDEENRALRDPNMRAFPVNATVVEDWSTIFSTTLNGEYREAASRKICLPYAADVVAIVVQHMYYMRNWADAPTVPPNVAMDVLALAQMHEQQDLFARAETGLMENDPCLFTSPDDGVGLVREALLLKVDVWKLLKKIREAKTATPGLFDADDEVFKPLLDAMCSGPLVTMFDVSLWTKYTPQIAEANMYTVWREAYWLEYRIKKTPLTDVRHLQTRSSFETDVAAARYVTRCGTMSELDMKNEVSDISRYNAEHEDEAGIMMRRGFKFHEYCAFMRKVYPLPPGYLDLYK